MIFMIEARQYYLYTINGNGVLSCDYRQVSTQPVPTH